ncbi:hypothetical protein BSKO_00765 [Bryopsis sp. KO-2023]|nr:hypothetical protein BSKO_00765 [Bryopsis sp. KO-2023]
MDSFGGNLYVAVSDVIRNKDDGGRLRTCLETLHQEIKAAGSGILRAAYSSLSLPLTLIVRSSTFLKKNPAAQVQVPAASNDRVVEVAVKCMTAIFEQGIQGDFSIDVLYPFADLLTLKKENSSEELRELSLKCLCALLENWPGSVSDIQHEPDGANPMDAIRFIVYRCVTYAGEEGPRGNRHIAANAYKSIKLLAEHFPLPKLWMPVLPGCIAEFSRTLFTAGNGINMSGPSLPASSVVVEALGAMVAVVETTLNNQIVDKVKPVSEQNPVDTLDALISSMKTDGEYNGAQKGAVDESRNAPQPSTSTPGPDGSWEWCAYTATKLEESFGKCLPSLQHHPAVSVRRKLGEGVVALLSNCSVALEASNDTLLRIVLTLVYDEWEKVSSPCCKFLDSLSRQMSSSSKGNGQEDHPLAKIVELIIKQRSGNLRKAIENSSQEGVAAARQLASALEIAGPLRVHQLLIGSPVRLSAFCTSITRCFAFDPTAAPLLLKSSAEPGPHLKTPNRSIANGDASSTVVQGASTPKKDAGVATDSAMSSAVELPRMPVGLFLMNESLYRELARVARVLGWMAYCQDEESRGLHYVIDALEEVLRRNMQESMHPLDAGSAVVVISEVLFGTYTATSVLKKPVAKSNVQSDYGSETIQTLVMGVLDAYTSLPLWSAKTYNDEHVAGDPLSTEALGQNAMLVRTLLDSVGTFARVVGKSFAEGGQILRLALMPMLERLGDPCPLVQAAAETAVDSVCWHCGYGSLEQLVSANGDYIVDGLCSQLRQIHLYPHAPHLFAALLRRARVAPKLLPLLAEPATLSLKGVAIVSRAITERYTPAFLQAMLEIVTCAEKESKNLLEESEACAQALNARVQEVESKKTHQGDANDMEMFLNEPEDDFDMEKDVLLEPREEEQLELRMRRTHSTSVLASSVAELSGPLMSVKDIRVSLLALSVCSMALMALKSSSRCHSIDDQIREGHVSKHRLASNPTPPKPEMVLPMLHILWNPLKSALSDSRIAAMEGALNALVSVTKSGGSRFLASRFKKDIWPIFERIVSGKGQASGRTSLRLLEEETAPNTVMRSKLSVMSCVARIAEEEETRGVFKGFIRPLVETLVPLLGKSQALPIREAASKAIVSLAKMDPDVVWFVLTDVVAAHGSRELWTSPHTEMLPHQKQLLPRIGGERGGKMEGMEQNVGAYSKPYFLTKKLAADCGERAAALLAKVEAESVEWHMKIDELLE